MRNKIRHTDFKKVLLQRFAFLIAILYLLSPFQQQLSTVMHRLSHDLGAPDYIMTHSGTPSGEAFDSHQTGDHHTADIIHDHQLIDFFQSLLEDNSKDEQSSDPIVPTKSFDKHLVSFWYHIAHEFNFEQKSSVNMPVQGICSGHSDLWLEPPIHRLV